MKRNGHSLVEVLLAAGVLSLVMSGSIAVYWACNKTWLASDISMQAARRSNLVMQRIVSGYAGVNGVRSAIGSNVVVVAGTTNWSVTYDTVEGGQYRFVYNRAAQQVLYYDRSGGNTNAPSRLAGSRIVASSVVSMGATGLTVTVQAVASNRQAQVTNALTTFVRYRN